MRNSGLSYGTTGVAATTSRSTLLAFIFLVIIGGSNAVAVRLSSLDIPPFWGAASRFGLAGLIFWVIVLTRRIALPKGRALAWTIFYGLLSIGLSYAFLYWALILVSASMTMVTLALVPLLTFFFAVIHRTEPFRWRGLLGALIALAGIMFGLSGPLGEGVPLERLLALVAGAACIAESSVLFKRIPPTHPVATNAVAVSSGAVFLAVVSLFAGEAWVIPDNPPSWAYFLYLVVVGSVLLFYLYLYVLSRWTASATSYSFLLFPVSTVIIATLLIGEVITPLFILGGALVLLGVWFGTIAGGERLKEPEAAASRLR